MAYSSLGSSRTSDQTTDGLALLCPGTDGKLAALPMSGSEASEGGDCGDPPSYSELDELDSVQTHRPSSLAALVRATRFTEGELKRIYRGFKAECPTGLVREDAFKLIYQQFFPQGANAGQYAHYVFRTLDQDHSGLLNFENFVHGLSVLSRGSIDEKLRWTFSLYDVNGDGRITREELADVVGSVYEIMGKMASTDHATVQEKVDRIFQKLDLNGDGVVTLDEFLDACLHDEEMKRSMAVFDSCF